MTFAVSATGHAAMDCVMNNMVERGDVVLVAENGIWGVRAGDMASRHGRKKNKNDLWAYVQCRVMWDPATNPC